MSILEKQRGFKEQRQQLQKIILQSVAIAGVLGVGLLLPNVLGAMAKLKLLPGRRQKTSIETSRDRLIRNGLLVWQGNKLRLTELGSKKLRLLELRDYRLRKPPRWDGKWRVLIFDIPERRRATREKVRRTLAAIGFVRLQDSVWFYPYNCEDLITLLKADFRTGKDLLYLIVESVENDLFLRRHFGFS